MLQFALTGKKYEKVKSLTGYRKSVRIPEQITSGYETMIASMGVEQISEDLEEVRTALRTGFKFKRKELTVSDTGDGTGTIVTPFFNYSITVSCNPENPAEAIWLRQVDEISDADQIFSDAFADAFGQMFDTVELSPPAPIEIEALIDRIEELEIDRIELDYDHQATWCQIQLPEFQGQVHVTSDNFSVIQKGSKSTKALLASLLDVQNIFNEDEELQGMLFRQGA
ncbi:MAG: hypothetical protein COA78_36950 [Blastopirellula sp.]|nr:MAG: hypothetical protein COA78_36950 [Blastopirellula sp.]